MKTLEKAKASLHRIWFGKEDPVFANADLVEGRLPEFTDAFYRSGSLAYTRQRIGGYRPQIIVYDDPAFVLHAERGEGHLHFGTIAWLETVSRTASKLDDITVVPVIVTDKGLGGNIAKFAADVGVKIVPVDPGVVDPDDLVQMVYARTRKEQT